MADNSNLQIDIEQLHRELDEEINTLKKEIQEINDRTEHHEKEFAEVIKFLNDIYEDFSKRISGEDIKEIRAKTAIMSQKIASNIEELERYEMEEKVLLAKKTQLESMIFATRSENEKFNNLLKQLVNCALDLGIKSNGEPATATTPARGDDKASNGEVAADLKNGGNGVEKAEESVESMGFGL